MTSKAKQQLRQVSEALWSEFYSLPLCRSHKGLSPAEECRLRHHEAVCDQDQAAGEPPKSLKGWVYWERHGSC